MILHFVAGLVIGGAFGMVLMGLLVSAGRRSQERAEALARPVEKAVENPLSI